MNKEGAILKPVDAGNFVKVMDLETKEWSWLNLDTNKLYSIDHILLPQSEPKVT